MEPLRLCRFLQQIWLMQTWRRKRPVNGFKTLLNVQGPWISITIGTIPVKQAVGRVRIPLDLVKQAIGSDCVDQSAGNKNGVVWLGCQNIE